MALDFSEFFKRYEAIIGEADQVFNTVKAKFADNVRCEKGCSDCCHALFDLTLVEALYLNSNFYQRFSGKDKNAVLERADEADRLVHRLKRDAFKAVKEGANAQEILAEMAKVRVRCPLLDDAGACQMYDKRPVTCRIYGVPTAIGGSAHTCGKSGFEQGKPYPTVYLDRIQDRLYALSHELAGSLATRYKGLGEVLVPASLALLTDYSEEYLGIMTEKEAADAKSEASAPKAAPAAPVAPAAPAARPRAQMAPMAKNSGKGLAACKGCAPETKKGGCAGCTPTSLTIGQAPAAKKPAAKKTAAKKSTVKKKD
ncbi:MAG: YkgJ family cysteine cluster protein [Humidesulfovibrio sp.]|uniref:YkgJ family cysteine cluster protein n=1 Tax=Humidesulfovibrio sp. TaxID=2910988 RepID=UPI0027364913|nr:YkgJ family cysteine cluster protein [Humidesulfovibrio sp.]MDP2848528.1 YkgJ family cysteine cluster protein [Humidesulfovibrio sp.]